MAVTSAVAHRMDRVDRPRVAVMRHLCDLVHLRLGELCVRSHHADRSIRSILHHHAIAVHHRRHRIAIALAILTACTRYNLTRLRTHHIAHCIYRHQRTHHDPRVPDLRTRGPQPRLHRKLRPEHLSNRRTRTRAYAAL